MTRAELTRRFWREKLAMLLRRPNLNWTLVGNAYGALHDAEDVVQLSRKVYYRPRS